LLAQGRLLASFWITNPKDKTYLLWLSSDIAEEFFKKLSMYKLRSKVSLELMSESWKIVGILNSDKNTPAFVGKYNCRLPEVNYAGKTYQRLLVADDQLLIHFKSENEFWSLLEVVSAIPRITNNTKDLFVPQMINFESVYGVRF
jgi:folate-binding Fe-S cluster repair protein YgfZ